MGGGLMQLVAYGAQDIYLTGNPQITFFKVVYRRHTNFAMEAIEQTFNGTADFGKSVTATMARNGDLLSRVYLQVDLPTLAGGTLTGSYVNWVNNTGHAMIKECEVEIGGQTIDKQYGVWMDAWNELNDSNGNEHGLINKHNAGTAYLKSNADAVPPTNRMYVPFQFWFCRNPGLALPLIALQYHEVKVKCTFRPLLALLNSDGVSGTLSGTPTIKCYADYIYLDTDERRRFAQVSHEYLIEQVQFTGSNTLKASNTLNFNHPVKELVWVCQTDTQATESTASASLGSGQGNTQNNFLCYTSATGNTEVVNGQTSYEAFVNGHLQLNGHDRFTARPASYFRSTQPYQHHDNVPSKHVYSYSFALKPSEHQPSGTCNFSRIDNASLKLTTVQSSSTIHVFAHSYNVLRVMSGMGGLAYSN
jgi:hypothetical protein